ncbi:MAG: four helix bundle protein [Lewinellaceae bacterium]|nr:four helix bundle protein [Lewinellaceae bacterium]
MEIIESGVLEEPRQFYSNENSKGFYQLDAWKKAHEFVLLVYEKTGRFPGEEKFGLTNQFRRAAVSIAANIAEGSGKNSTKDFIRYLIIARGSVEECQYYLILSKDLHYFSSDEFSHLKAILDSTGRLINGLIKFLQKKISNTK